MKTRRYFAPLLALVLVAVAFTIVPRADEGFWPYNNIPKTAIKQKYRFDVTDTWLNHLQLASVSFGGASGSIVSPDGLVLTNHHVGLSSAQRLSSAERDLVKNGFYAPTYADEIKVPNMTLRVLQSIEDVTAKVNAATAGKTPSEAQAARTKAITAIQDEANEATGLQCQVVTLYQGAVYNLYRYKVYTDVRLAFIVEYQVGFYGGDPDNFTYPRFNLDMSLFRLYEDGKPAQTPNYLRWSPNGSKENELVFTTGHPGRTQRLYTVAHLQYLRDVSLPYTIANNEMQERTIQKWAALGEENRRQTVQRLFGIQNSLKSQRGQLKGLQDPALMAKKEKAEAALRAALAKNAAKEQELGDAWTTIEKSLQRARELDAERNFLAGGTSGPAGLNSQLFTQARTLVHAAYTPEQPAAGRGGRGGRGGQPGGEGRGGRGGEVAAINTDLEKLQLTESLAFMKSRLPATSPIVKLILGDKTPEARAKELVEKTRIMDPEFRAILQAGGKPAIEKVTSDPMIVLAREIETQGQEIAKKYEAEVTAVQAAAYPKVAQAVFAVYGPNAYPDATSTLRLSYGTVKSYMENGKKIAPYTTIGGLYARAAEHNAQPPYDLAPKWVEKKSAVVPATPFNFVSTNDIVGGNSGSPVVNTRGEVVGLVFDGNIQSLPGYFIFDESVNRAVSVDSRGIIEALRKVYGAGALADEMTGKKRISTN